MNRISFLTLLFLLPAFSWGQATTQKPKKAKKPPEAFKWVNPIPDGKWPFLTHATFKSPTMSVDVGYCIHLPKAYHEQPDKRFPGGVSAAWRTSRQRTQNGSHA